MLTCYQFKDMNMLQHGQAVHHRWLQLSRHLDGEALEGKWRLPSYTQELWNKLRHEIPSAETMKLAQLYHDNAKHECRVIDEQGRQHFPGHAEASYQRFLKHSKNILKTIIAAELIRLDMTFHTLRGEELEPYYHHPLGFTLWLTALCEIHANSEMFGGIESDSFKIKWKRLEKAGKRF